MDNIQHLKDLIKKYIKVEKSQHCKNDTPLAYTFFVGIPLLLVIIATPFLAFAFIIKQFLIPLIHH